MSKSSKHVLQQTKLILEELEERRLFSGGIEGLIDTDLDSDANAIYRDLDSNQAQADRTNGDIAAAEQQSQEIVFVDAGVDNYQQLVDDLLANSDASRNIEVVVLDQDKDGIEAISTYLQDRGDLDAIHIISHGSDGSVELGNTSLNSDTLEQNNFKIALWANSFAETGDILIYGCNLAESEVGESLINKLSELTLTDVAVSNDLTDTAQVLAQQIVFLDTAVEDYQTLMAGIDPNAEIVLLDTDRDGVEQIAEALEGRSGIDAIHLIAEGNAAELHLGDGFLTQESISGQYADLFTRIGGNLSENADLLIYGCNFGQGEEGLLAVESLAALTGADIAASDDRTGHTGEYGDWVLEVNTGLIESSVIISKDAQSTWQEALSTYTVSNTNDSGAGSLRQAIIDANASAGTDNIFFDISDALVGGAHTISLLSALPDISETVTIDGTIDSDFAGTPIVVLDGSSAGADVDGLTLAAGSDGSTIRGLVINQFSKSGILVYSDGNTIEGNYIGTDVTGMLDLGNTTFGINVTTGAENNTIGGTTAAQRNVISGNDSIGINLYGASTTGNVVQGNYIGVSADGTTALGNTLDGVRISYGASANTIGGDQTAGEGNVISGNLDDGIAVSRSGTDNNQIYGNYIGTDYTGLVAVANARYGVVLYDGVQGTEVGGTGTGEGNVISGNTSRGVSIDGNGQTTSGNMLVANYIGVGSDGTTALGNGNDGIWIYQADDNVVGSTTAGNVIAANS
ncbi:MAG: DUF4347 domain-containing protein, partial [Gammaproteobacteria bacterium]|nr:DUF4347 domain-containing protein [Gammaproteobacteria bacterium]